MEKNQIQENRFGDIARDIKLQILQGQLAPGSRMPTRAKLEKKYKTSSVTLQKALKVLMDEGFVFTRGRKGGSFISLKPPCLSRIALLVPQEENPAGSPNLFYQSVLNQVDSVSEQNDLAIEVFYGYANLKNFNAFTALIEDLIAQKYAGVIFASPPFELRESPLLSHPDIIRAGIMSKEHFPHIPRVSADGKFMSLAVEKLAAMGCKKPMMLTFSPQAHIDPFKQSCKNFGMEFDDRRLLVTGRQIINWTGSYVKSLMAMEKNIRPDCMLITDDLLEPYAVQGLIDAGITPKNNFPILAYCNFPLIQESQLNVIHLGCNTDSFLELLVQLIKKQQSKTKVPMFTPIPTIFEEEYVASF